MLLHRSDLNIQKKIVKLFRIFWQILQIWSLSLIFAQSSMKFLGISPLFVENVEHSWKTWIRDETLQNLFYSERILTELWSEKFEWFDPSPIEPFNQGIERPAPATVEADGATGEAGVRPPFASARVAAKERSE